MSTGARVVVTGLGAITPLGESADSYVDALVAGRSGITAWREPDERCYSRIGGDLSGFDAGAHLDRTAAAYPAEMVRRARKLLRPTPLAGRITLPAALQAWTSAGLLASPPDPERVGHVLAGHNINNRYMFENHRQYVEEPEYIDPLYGVVNADTDLLAVVCELLGIRGTSFTVGGACATGNLAVLNAFDLLRCGRADLVLVTGAATDLERPLLHALALIDAISFRSFNDDPTRASRPFDRLREGFVPSQAAGALVLETRAHAERRGAPIRAEILGAFACSDASRLTKPDVDGQVRAIHGALRAAGVAPESVQYVNAHATSTPLGDAIEVAALKHAFGDHAYRMPVNATKSMLGHCLSASGVLELVATIGQMERGTVHPTINLEEPDPELDLDFVAGEARAARIDVAISNAFGFGGLNSSVVVGRDS